MSEGLNCRNCCIGDFKYELCDCDGRFCKEFKKIGTADDFEKDVLEHVSQKTEVVRCRDCYYAEDDITHMFCVYFHHKVYEDDYCSNAVERREDGEA